MPETCKRDNVTATDETSVVRLIDFPQTKTQKVRNSTKISYYFQIVYILQYFLI